MNQSKLTMSEANSATEKESRVILCKRCHRKLKDEISKKLGYGKICYQKIKKHNNYLFKIEEDDKDV